MSRNATGTYTLPVGNPVVTSTLITSSWANTTMTDIETALTDSLSRSGNGGMTAQLKGVAGTKALPMYSWTDYPDQGIYAASSGDVRMSVAGNDQMRWENGTVSMWNATSGAWTGVVTEDNPTRSAVLYSSVSTEGSGTNVIDESFLGVYNRMTVTGALTYQIQLESSANWTVGDTLDFAGITETGGPHVVTFEGVTNAVTFNENGNTGSTSFVATQSTGILIRLVYVAADEWDVIELYI